MAVENVQTRSSLDLLPYVDGASWLPELICLPGTREDILTNVQSWMTADSPSTPIAMLLIGPVGTGKTAISHTVAKICHEAGILGSSFFFDSSVADRNSSERVISTIVRDLASRDERYASALQDIIQSSRSLASTLSPLLQLQEFIIKPYEQIKPTAQIVIVVDALDEGADHHFLQAIGKLMPQLPRHLRFFFTSRPEHNISMALSCWPPASLRRIEFDSGENIRDVATYSRHSLRRVAATHRLDAAWPGESMLLEFTQRANGLFIWTHTVTQFLILHPSPKKKLYALLNDDYRKHSSRSAEESMDKLYADILKVQFWKDQDFQFVYDIVLGTLIASRGPLSADAIHVLHADQFDITLRDVEDLLSRVASLLMPVEDSRTPIRLLHLSVFEFLTDRAFLQPGTHGYGLEWKSHNARLALLCVQHLIKISDKTSSSNVIIRPGPSFAIEDGIAISPIEVSEVTLYACKFWMSHVVNARADEEELTQTIADFFTSGFDGWLAIVATADCYRSMDQFCLWAQVRHPPNTDATDTDLNALISKLSLTPLSFETLTLHRC